MSTPPPTAAASPAPVPARGPLRRQRVGRRIGGVAVGVAQHLGIKTSTARWAFVLTAPIGIGLVMYLWLWLLVPTSDATGPPPALARLAPLLNNPERRAPAMRLVAGLVCLFAAALVAAAAVGVKIPWQWLFPGFALLGGIALAWSQLDRTDAAAGRGPVSWLRLGAALALMVLGIALMVSQGRGPMSLLFALLAGLAVLASVAVLLAPWWLR
ncbi:MAG: PspC domain-containing protein, partial [Bifidobacteriaceae bacterium]|nr:PspC domain-containing protein [Bifidobacteriaceae bacterium]